MRHFGAIRIALSCFVVVAFAAIVVLDVHLVWQNHSLKADLRAAIASTQPPIGSPVPTLNGVAIGGQAVSIRYGLDRRPTFLFLFTRGCAYCSATWPQWRRLVDTVKPSQARLVFLNLGTAVDESFVSAYGLAGQTVLNRVDPNDVVAYNMLLTPTVLEVDGSGVLRHGWVGEPGAAGLAEMESIAGN